MVVIEKFSGNSCSGSVRLAVLFEERANDVEVMNAAHLNQSFPDEGLAQNQQSCPEDFVVPIEM